MEPLLTIKEVAGVLKVTERTVYTLLKSGDIPRIRIRGAVRIRQEDLKNYIERQAEGKVDYDPESFREIRDRMAERKDSG